LTVVAVAAVALIDDGAAVVIFDADLNPLRSGPVAPFLPFLGRFLGLSQASPTFLDGGSKRLSGHCEAAPDSAPDALPFVRMLASFERSACTI
jgi:hypothetical protein